MNSIEHSSPGHYPLVVQPSLVAIVPMSISPVVTFVAAKRIITGLTAGAVKG